MQSIKRLPTKKMPDGSLQPVGIEDWVRENLTGDELAAALETLQRNAKLVIAHQNSGNTNTKIIENGVVVGWTTTHVSNFDPDPGMAALEVRWKNDNSLTWTEDVIES
jgi:hypothetical protein